MSAERWPCVFKERFIREEVDPRVQEAWKATTRKSAPFGYMRRIWRERHCATINPYGSDNCPYEKRQCGAAFLATAITAASADPPQGWFWTEAKIGGIERADNKPLARHHASQLQFRTDEQEGPSNPHTPHARSDPGRGGDAHGEADQELQDGYDQHSGRPSDMPGSGIGPEPIGELLGKIDFGPHQGPFTNGKEGTK